METRIFPLLMALTISSCTAAVLGQATNGQPVAASRATVHNGPTPHTAEFRISNVRTLANGTTITKESTEVRAIDAQGRSMSAFTNIPTAPEETTVTSFSVVDPVAGTSTSWDSGTHQAKVVKQPPRTANSTKGTCWITTPENVSVAFTGPAVDGQSKEVAGPEAVATKTPSAPAARTNAISKETATEDLGTAVIDGLEAHGKRYTTTTPIGAAGNDQPLVSTRETWWADTHSIGMSVREFNNDPVNGKYTRELVKLSLEEPDPALFEPPDGYEILTQEMHQVPCQHPGVNAQ